VSELQSPCTQAGHNRQWVPHLPLAHWEQSLPAYWSRHKHLDAPNMNMDITINDTYYTTQWHFTQTVINIKTLSVLIHALLSLHTDIQLTSTTQTFAHAYSVKLFRLHSTDKENCCTLKFNFVFFIYHCTDQYTFELKFCIFLQADYSKNLTS